MNRLEDYTKFKLKKEDELESLLEGKDNLFVVACNKCFKEFLAEEEPECGEFATLAGLHGKLLTGCVKVDFLCNKHLTSKRLDAVLPAETENVFVIACGLGIQTVAGLAGIPVYAASDSVSFGGRHGLALTKRLCAACGQCYLNFTGGICPIVDCSKSLVNGQCGGSKNGKCEADRDKDCAWSRIFERLDAQDRAGILSRQPVQLHDYSRVSFKLVNDHVKAIREKRFEGYYGGLHPSSRKELSEHLPLIRFPAPRTVTIPLSQHTGAPSAPLVKAGDHVKMGQKIGEAAGYISCATHSSVSGIVTGVLPRRHPNTGLDVLSVVIESDGKDEQDESVKPCPDWDSLPAEDIAALIREKGIAGMGGAGFPTSVKLKPPKPIDTVLLNGCECEPLLTADHRVMLEFADDVIFGLKVLLKTAGADRGIIVIEDNKRDAIELFETKTSDIPEIGILSARTKYPQGAEKMLIKRALGRHVPSGALPFDVGVIVSNVSTAKAISDAIQTGMPLIERVLTVSGERIRNPGNFVVKIGTSVKEIIDYCGIVTGATNCGVPATNGGAGNGGDSGVLTDAASAGVSGVDAGGDATIKLGGPMMGFDAGDLDVPVIKGTNGIIAIEPAISEPSECIRCGRCVDVCPMELLPLYYPQYAGRADWNGMKEKSVSDCIECGCCDFICSSKIPITDAIKIGKMNVQARE